jgi:hypothetical protein
MRPPIRLAALLCLLGPAAPRAGDLPAAAAPPRLVVLDVGGPAAGARSRPLAEQLSAALANAGTVSVVSRAELAELVDLDDRRAMESCAEQGSCLAQLAQALHADYVLASSVATAREPLMEVEVRLVEGKRGFLLSRAAELAGASNEKLSSALLAAGRKVLSSIATAAAPVASVPPRPNAAAAPAPVTAAPTTAAAGRPASSVEAPVPESSLTWDLRNMSAWPRWQWAYVAGGAGAVGLAGGLVLGLLARSAYNAEKDAAANHDPAAFASNRDAVRPRSIAADAFFILGAVGAGAGAYLYWTDHGASRLAAAPAVIPGGVAATVRGEF